MGSFLLYSVHEGIRGIPLDPSDQSDALVPVSGTSLAVGIDFHAGECTATDPPTTIQEFGLRIKSHQPCCEVYLNCYYTVPA